MLVACLICSSFRPTRLRSSPVLASLMLPTSTFGSRRIVSSTRRTTGPGASLGARRFEETYDDEDETAVTLPMVLRRRQESRRTASLLNPHGLTASQALSYR